MKTLHLTVRTTLISIRRGIALVVDVGGLANVTKCNNPESEVTELSGPQDDMSFCFTIFFSYYYFTDAFSLKAIPSSSPTHSGYVEWEAKRGKWSK